MNFDKKWVRVVQQIVKNQSKIDGKIISKNDVNKNAPKLLKRVLQRVLKWGQNPSQNGPEAYSKTLLGYRAMPMCPREPKISKNHWKNHQKMIPKRSKIFPQVLKETKRNAIYPNPCFQQPAAKYGQELAAIAASKGRRWIAVSALRTHTHTHTNIDIV